MTFKQFGYTKKEIEVREMTMGAIVHTAAQNLIKNDRRDMEIRIVDTFMGEVDIYKNYEELLLTDFQDNWRVNVYSAVVMHDNKLDKDYLKIIISDDIEMMD